MNIVILHHSFFRGWLILGFPKKESDVWIPKIFPVAKIKSQRFLPYQKILINIITPQNEVYWGNQIYKKIEFQWQ